MRVLFVAATRPELSPFLDSLVRVGRGGDGGELYRWREVGIDVVITGVGMLFTAFHLTCALQDRRYDLVVNAGIAGSFTKRFEIGAVVDVRSEQIGGLGIECPDGFCTLFEAGYMQKGQHPFTGDRLENPHFTGKAELPIAKGVTSDTSHGSAGSISLIEQKFLPDVESMEGAAVFYVCLMKGVPFLEIRSVSNYVEVRDVSKWNVSLAVENLSRELLRVLERVVVCF